MKLLRHILLATLPVALTACEKELDFDYHDIPAVQVIEGQLTDDGVSVRLTRTVATDEPFDDHTVTDAAVTVTDMTEGRTYTLEPDGDGIFTHPGLAGATGHEYTLDVTTAGATYRSSSRMLPPTTIVSAEFNWITMPYDDVAVLRVQFTCDSDPLTCYWLRVYRNGEPYKWQAIESRNAVDGLVTGMMLTSRRDTDREDDEDILTDGDVVSIEVSPISRTMADYLNSLNNGDYNGNLMFTGSYCLGYFLAAPVAHTALTFHPDLIPYAE